MGTRLSRDDRQPLERPRGGGWVVDVGRERREERRGVGGEGRDTVYEAAVVQ